MYRYENVEFDNMGLHELIFFAAFSLWSILTLALAFFFASDIWQAISGREHAAKT